MDEHEMEHDGIFIYIQGRKFAAVGTTPHAELAANGIRLMPHYRASAAPAAPAPVDLGAARAARQVKGSKPGPR